MKLEHFYSDWNGQKASKPYNQEPSKQTLQQAKTLGKVCVGEAIVFVTDNLCEVRTRIQGDFGGNVYRDMYRIKA